MEIKKDKVLLAAGVLAAVALGIVVWKGCFKCCSNKEDKKD